MRKSVLSAILLCFFPFYALLGANEDFTVQTLVGGDSTPPSVPANLIATAITASQIDLSWSSSTDNFLLSGYHVWRDDALIATTTEPSYQDTGLATETAYAYYVTAFDSSLNESASSSAATATTPSIPLPPPPDAEDGTIFGFRYRPLAEEIQVLEILPQMDSVIIRFETRNHIRATLRWGTGAEYEIGSIAEQAFLKAHEITITGLNPSTEYQFVIDGQNKIGRYGTMYAGDFRTLPPIDMFAPGNVLELSARTSGDDIVLAWRNPNDADFAKVRVMRNERFYPVDEADGWVVYEGTSEGARDAGAAKGSGTVYYTIFTYDALGNISSGAIVSVDLSNGQPTAREPLRPELNPITLAFGDIEFIQDGKKLEIESGTVRIDGAKQFTISIPYEKLPEHLKTILVVLDDRDTGKSFKFLLRINKATTAYESMIAPLRISGEYPIEIAVFDYKTAQIGYGRGIISSRVASGIAESESILPTIAMIGRSPYSWLLLIMLLIFFFQKRMKRPRKYTPA
jgi:hypothetical protein